MRKVVLITGGGKGIGKATVLEFAKHGYDVVLNYFKSEKPAQKLAKEVKDKFGVDVMTFKADVSDEKQVNAMISATIKKFGRIDSVVNNAGIVFDRDFDKITVEEFKRVLEVNLIGAFIVSRESAKFMKKGTSIVNVSSTNGTKTISPECLDYNASKVGLQSLTRDLAFHFKPNIRVNAVAIGWANTDMNKDLPKEYVAEENAKIWLGRFAKPEQVASAIYFLCDDSSSYVNGEVLTIDGGYC